MEKRTKQDQIIEELEYINANLKMNYVVLDAISKTLKNKTLEVNQTRAASTIIFISLYTICAIFIAYGITQRYNFNDYITTGFIGLVIIIAATIIYYSNN
jgi:hypothetical protein